MVNKTRHRLRLVTNKTSLPPPLCSDGRLDSDKNHGRVSRLKETGGRPQCWQGPAHLPSIGGNTPARTFLRLRGKVHSLSALRWSHFQGHHRHGLSATTEICLPWEHPFSKESKGSRRKSRKFWSQGLTVAGNCLLYICIAVFSSCGRGATR